MHWRESFRERERRNYLRVVDCDALFIQIVLNLCPSCMAVWYNFYLKKSIYFIEKMAEAVRWLPLLCQTKHTNDGLLSYFKCLMIFLLSSLSTVFYCVELSLSTLSFFYEILVDLLSLSLRVKGWQRISLALWGRQSLAFTVIVLMVPHASAPCELYCDTELRKTHNIQSHTCLSLFVTYN